MENTEKKKIGKEKLEKEKEFYDKIREKTIERDMERDVKIMKKKKKREEMKG